MVQILEDRCVKFSKVGGRSGCSMLHVFLPIPPATDELAVIQIVLDQIIGDRQKNRGFAARIGRNPVISMCCTIRQPYVKDNQFAP